MKYKLSIIYILLFCIAPFAKTETKSKEGFPVLNSVNDTLFNIYEKSGSFSAMERAEAIQKRIISFEKEAKYKKPLISIRESEQDIEIYGNDKVLINLTYKDAQANHTGLKKLAINYKSILEKELKRYQENRSLKTILKEIGLILLIILILVITLKLNNKLFKYINEKVNKFHIEGKLLKEIKFNDFTLIDSNKVKSITLYLAKVLKIVFIFSIIYLTIPFLFGIFPWTKHIADQLLNYFILPIKSFASGVWNYLPNLFTIIVISIIFRYLIKGLKFIKNAIENGDLKINGFFPDWANPTFQIIKILLYAFMLILIFPYLPGSDSTIFRGVSVFIGVLFSFGSAGSLSNIIAGLVITYMRLFKIGDRVKVNEVTGDVIEKSLLVTRIRTIKNEIVSIPNSTIMTNHSINYSSDAIQRGLILNTTVTIGYDVPWKKVHNSLIEAALRTKGIESTPLPFILQTSLNDFYVSYQLNGYTKLANQQSAIYSELHQHIQDVFQESSIEIMSPHYNSIRDGNETTIPKKEST